MLVKAIIIIIFLMILFNLFSALRYLLSPDNNGDKLYARLKWRIIISFGLFLLIILGAMIGFVPVHKFG